MSDTFAEALRRFVLGATRPLDYLGHYSGIVSEQHDDGTVDVTPDDARLPSFQRLRVRWGAAGVVSKLKANAPCTVGWENGDPRRPYVSGFAAEAFDEVWLGGATASSNFIALSNLVKDRLDAIVSSFNSHTHSGVQTGTGASGAPAAPISGSNNVASGKVRST